MRVFIDTSIFISVFNEEPNFMKSRVFLEKVFKGEIEGLISVITLSELMSFYYKCDRWKSFSALALIEKTVGNNHVISVDKTIAIMAGRLKSKYGHDKNALSLGDTLILSSAMMTDSDVLVTLDDSFKKVEEIIVKKPEEV